MTNIIRFPGNKTSEPLSQVTPVEASEGTPILSDKGEPLGFTLEEAGLAMDAIHGMTEHFEGAKLDLSDDALKSRAEIVDEYTLAQIVKMMGQSEKKDWMKHPAFYGALAKRFLTDVLGGEEDGHQEVDAPITGLRLVKPDDAFSNPGNQ